MKSGAKIKALRQAQFPKAEGFARRIGVSTQELSRIETRGTGSDEKLLEKIAKELRVPVAQLR